MTAHAWALLSGALAVTMEATFKVSPNYLDRAWMFVPGAVLLNYMIFRLVNASPSLPAAVVLFSATTLTLRIGVSLIMGHAIGLGTWAAVVLILLAATLRTLWP